MLILSVILSLKSFSQTDTSKICLDKTIAKLVIKDLMRLDGCKLETEQLYIKIAKIEEREAQKDSAIVVLNDKVKNNEFVISKQGEQIVELKTVNTELKKDLDSSGNQLTWWRRGAIAGGVTTIILLIIAF